MHAMTEREFMLAIGDCTDPDAVLSALEEFTRSQGHYEVAQVIGNLHDNFDACIAENFQPNDEAEPDEAKADNRAELAIRDGAGI
jgi:hypothetical protein